MKKLILIVLDGLNAKTAFNHLGFMEHLVEEKIAAAYLINSQLPAMSRPLYEVIQTGVPVWQNGIYNNFVERKTKEESLFSLVKKAGGLTAAAAYHWIYDLYIGKEKNPIEKRFALNETGEIDKGIFYWEDSYPDSHLFADGHFLIKTYNPDYILIHSMEIDNVGHLYGGESAEYIKKSIAIDVILSNFIPIWKEMGYDIIITADHGMNTIGQHNGKDNSERKVPLYIISNQVEKGDFRQSTINQLEIAPLCCQLMGIKKSIKMKDITIRT